MERYVGMDVHGDSCTALSMSAKGKRQRQDVIETNGQALLEYLGQLSGSVHLCIEETEWSSWLWEVLSPHVAEMVVVRGERRQGASKSDALDALALADRLRTNRLGHPVYKAPREFARLREQARVYWGVTQDLTRSKNRLKSVFRRRGVGCDDSSVYHKKGRAPRIRQLPAALRDAAALLGDQVDHLIALKSQVESSLIEESHRHKISYILETIPGLGEIRVAQLLPIVVTPHRFRTKRQFWCYCGFGIVSHSSADWVRTNRQWVRSRQPQTRGLNKNRNPRLKAIFKGAATTVIHPKSHNAFHTAYDQLCEQGTKPNLAKVTVARKLAATTWTMWKNEEIYDPER